MKLFKRDALDETYDTYTEEKKTIKIINIIFTIIIAIIIVIIIDIICVKKINTGPFFAIRTKTYNDGGTTEYYGLGYKVIKYNQTQGRRDTQLGLWSMPYSVEPTTISSLDLAIELRNYPEKTYKKYANKFLRVNGTLDSIDSKDNKLTIKYTDPDGKYNLKIICSMADKNSNIENFSTDDEVTAIGIVSNFKPKNNKNPNRLYMSNCFAE